MDQEIGKKLDALVRLTALQVLGERTGKEESIGILVRAGLDNDVIADVVGTTPATVRAARSRARKKGK